MADTNNDPAQVKMGKEEEQEVDGVKRLVRRNAEKFKGEIPGVDQEATHEDFYDVDVLNKD